MEEVIDSINQVLSSKPLVFITQEAERGLGLEEYLDNYFIVSQADDLISDELENLNLGKAIAVGKGTEEVLKSARFAQFVRSRLGENSQVNLQFFKNTRDGAEEIMSSHGIIAKVLNNTAKLTRRIENKLNQYEDLKNNGFAEYLPQTVVQQVSTLSFSELEGKEAEYIVQFPFGHTGSSTTTIGPELKEMAASQPNRIIKLSKKIVGEALTVNACIYRGRVYVGGLSYQFTGVPELTPLQFATVGNDWEAVAKIVSAEKRQEITDLTVRIGEFLSKQYSFRGFFGLDLVQEAETGKIYLIEINPRQIASIPMHTKLQIREDQIPLAAINLLEFLDINHDIDPVAYNAEAMQPLQGAQIFLRSDHFEDYTIPLTNLKSGVYRQVSDNLAQKEINLGRKENVIYLDQSRDRPLLWSKYAYSVSNFAADGFLLVLKPSDSVISFNSEVARLQFNRGIYLPSNESTTNILPIAYDTLIRIKDILF